MPDPAITNPFGVNAAQGNEAYTSQLIVPFATDPAGNSHNITGMTTANPTVITTAAHGYITGQQVNINTNVAWSATGTVPNGNYVATVLSATTFSIPFNYTGTYTSGGGSYQTFQPGQLTNLQSWNGSVSGATGSPTYPTINITPLTTANFNCEGVILGGSGGIGDPVTIGGIAQVVVSGICQAYTDTTTTISNATLFVPSVATPGAGKPSTATSGKNVGSILSAVTVASAYLPQLCYVFVRLS
jgi:hypothetical protein